MPKNMLRTVMACTLLSLAGAVGSACGSGTALNLETVSPTESVSTPGARTTPTDARGGSTATARDPQPTEAVAATRQAPTEPAPQEGTSTGAGNADVLHVRAVQAANGTWTFHVTVQHPDTGWDDYADGWDVVLPDGTLLKPDPESPFTRLLLHPHVDEQPFTRSQGGITLPPGTTTVRVRAHDIVDGFGGREIVVNLTANSGQGFEVEPNP